MRYPVDKLQKNDLEAYRTLTIEDIDLVQPGAFGLESQEQGAKRTVYIRCASDTLEALSYKPRFPDSVFHVTLYDKHDLQFARQLLAAVASFPWGFEVPLPKGTRLSEIPIGRDKPRVASREREYPSAVTSLFAKLTAKELTHPLVQSLTAEERIKHATTICDQLHEATRSYRRVTNHPNSRVQSESNGQANPLANGDGRGNGSTTEALVREDQLAEVDRKLANKIGLFLTPPELARDIVAYALSHHSATQRNIDFGDPAVGTGVFFSALTQIHPRDLITSAIGIEVDAERVRATTERWSHRGLRVVSGDYLHMEQLPQRSLIVANPPYVRYQHMMRTYREKLRERASITLGMSISGQSSLYVYFLILSHHWMKADAIAAWLIPSEFMETQYGASIRDYLTRNVELIRIHQFSHDDMQFENALVVLPNGK